MSINILGVSWSCGILFGKKKHTVMSKPSNMDCINTCATKTRTHEALDAFCYYDAATSTKKTLWPVRFLAFPSSFKRWCYHGTKQPRHTGYQKETKGNSSYRKMRRKSWGRPVSSDHFKCSVCCLREHLNSKQDIHTDAKKTFCQSHRKRANTFYR